MTTSITEAADRPGSTPQLVTDTAAPVVRPVTDAVVPIVRPVTDAVAPIVRPVTDTVVPIVRPVTDTVVPIVRPVTDTVVPIVRPVTDTVVPIVRPVTDTVAPIVRPVTDTVAPIVRPVTDTVAPIVDPIVEPSGNKPETPAPVRPSEETGDRSPDSGSTPLEPAPGDRDLGLPRTSPETATDAERSGQTRGTSLVTGCSSDDPRVWSAQPDAGPVLRIDGADFDLSGTSGGPGGQGAPLPQAPRLPASPAPAAGHTGGGGSSFERSNPYELPLALLANYLSPAYPAITQLVSGEAAGLSSRAALVEDRPG